MKFFKVTENELTRLFPWHENSIYSCVSVYLEILVLLELFHELVDTSVHTHTHIHHMYLYRTAMNICHLSPYLSICRYLTTLLLPDLHLVVKDQGGSVFLSRTYNSAWLIFLWCRFCTCEWALLTETYSLPPKSILVDFFFFKD